MAESKKTDHSGHRQRMRSRVEENGLDSLAPHEALEYILYFTNARKDTNGIAHALIDQFGDFAGVLEASEEDLCQVEGVGPSTARLLHLLPEISRYYGRSRVSGTRRIEDTRQMADYLMAKFAWADYDRAMLAAGSYPAYLKARVEGDKGHLDNKVTARFVADMWNPELKFVFLNHLSNDNNTPEIALHETRSALEAKGATVGDASYAPDQANCDVQLYALPRYDTSTWFVL